MVGTSTASIDNLGAPRKAPSVVALITARGGSKGIPRKNVRLLTGKPMIAWTIEAAKQARGVSRVLISTDDEEIASVSKQWGAEVPFLRPAELAQDRSSHIAVAQHALHWLDEHEGFQPDYLLLLQPTCPLRTSGDIEAAIALTQKGRVRSVLSVCEANDHPYDVKRLCEDGRLMDYMSSQLAYERRQDYPPAYVVNGAIYLNRSDIILREGTFQPPDAVAYVMPPERSVDVDTPWDLRLVEMALEPSRQP
jgi:CMP-N,N'-diacetyllegionaminic acid synthase